MPDFSQYLNETGFLNLTPGNLFLIALGLLFIYTAIAKKAEPYEFAAHRHRSHNCQPAPQCVDTACPGRPTGSGCPARVRYPWAHLSFHALILEYSASLDIPWPWRTHRLHADYRESQNAASGWSGTGGHLRGFLGSSGYQPSPRNRYRLLHQGSSVYRHHRRCGRSPQQYSSPPYWLPTCWAALPWSRTPIWPVWRSYSHL